ncbi:MAG: fatty acid desaturase, partial [Saprospiraceae bacterium]|nr:fatty acid desaturase [Saprospiraceae bacterium]
SYLNAWELEAERLKKLGKPVFTWSNEMLRFQIIQITYLVVIGLSYGSWMIGYAVAIAIFGFLMLECVNYIEHYGLRRELLPNGRYEHVTPRHSWNSDHELGRIFLYELTRHSDHHYKATRKYQVLRHLDESPQLPLGYPASIIASLLPPLWFGIMNRRARQFNIEKYDN